MPLAFGEAARRGAFADDVEVFRGRLRLGRFDSRHEGSVGIVGADVLSGGFGSGLFDRVDDFLRDLGAGVSRRGCKRLGSR